MQRTFRPKNWINLFSQSSGFTLIEMLIVVLLIAMVATFFFGRVQTGQKANLDSASRKIAAVVKDAYNSTLVTGYIHRIVYDLKEKNYWVERTEGKILLESKESLEKKSAVFKDKDEEEDKEKEQGFSLADKITRKKAVLPGTVKFTQIYSEQSLEPVTQGVTYTHIFPNGFTEKTIIHLEDADENKKTIAVFPLAGRTLVEPGHLKEEEIFDVKK